MTFNIVTLGCKVNIYESEVIKENFLKAGYNLVEKSADINIINTCSVTNMADNKSKKIIRRIKRENPKSILVVCGCTAENYREKLLDFDIDVLIGNKDKSNLVGMVYDFIMSKKPMMQFYKYNNLEFEDMQVSKFTSQTRAFIKIQDGCDNYCSYCIIPFVRGNIRFKQFNKCMAEALELVKNNHQEIVLTGIHTGSYGRGEEKTLVDLINEMSKIDGLKRIRISSIEITEINDKFLDLLKKNGKVCDHLHIPLQSGNDKILKLMNRKYNTDYYKKMINKIRAIRPNISITTDVIVGFPNESEEDFYATYKYCKELEFSKIHVFPYSLRTGTLAASMDNQVLDIFKKKRSRVLTVLSDELQQQYNVKFINKKINVLIEEVIENSSYGFSSNYIKIKINKNLEKNKFYDVILEENENNIMVGKDLELEKYNTR